MLCGVFYWYDYGKYWILLDEPGWEHFENAESMRMWYAPIEDEE